MKKIIFVLINIAIFYCLFYNGYCTSTEQSSNYIEGLKELRVNYEGIVPEFDKNIYEYYLTISEDINNIEVFAIPENETCTIKITGNTDLKNGLNNIIINVISADNEQNSIYTIKVSKTNDVQLANTNLENLAIQDLLLKPPFDTNVTHYKAEVSNDVNKINILAIPQNENSKIEIRDEENLKEGENFIYIDVIAENGFSKKTYILNIYKRNEEETIKFIESQKINGEKLKGIYNTQRTNFDSNIENNESRILRIIVACLEIILFLAILFYILKIIRSKK